jgi:hypothetical protein
MPFGFSTDKCICRNRIIQIKRDFSSDFGLVPIQTWPFALAIARGMLDGHQQSTQIFKSLYVSVFVSMSDRAPSTIEIERLMQRVMRPLPANTASATPRSATRVGGGVVELTMLDQAIGKVRVRARL